MQSDAYISSDGQYRYWLSRRWGGGSLLPFIMLNPSTADASENDPTIRRCIKFAEREHYSGILVVNLWAYRATNPNELKSVRDPVGPENEYWVKRVLEGPRLGVKTPVVCAWGARGMLRREFENKYARGTEAQLLCLGMTGYGYPKHPLYLAGDTPLEPFTGKM
jgi:hypothetical protein